MVVNITKQFIKEQANPHTKPYEVYDKSVRGLLLRVQPTGNQVYYVTYLNSSGKLKRYKLAHASQICPQQARHLATQVLASVING